MDADSGAEVEEPQPGPTATAAPPSPPPPTTTSTTTSTTGRPASAAHGAGPACDRVLPSCCGAKVEEPQPPTPSAAPCSPSPQSEAGCGCEGKSHEHNEPNEPAGPMTEHRRCGLCLEPQYTHERLYACPGCGTDVCVPKCRPSRGDYYSSVCSRCLRLSAAKSWEQATGGETAPQRVPSAFLAEWLLSEHDPDYAQARREHATAVKRGASLPAQTQRTPMYAYKVDTVRASLPRDPLHTHYPVKWAPVQSGMRDIAMCDVCPDQAERGPCPLMDPGLAMHCRMCGRAGCLMQAADWPLLPVPGLQGLSPICLRCTDDYLQARLHEQPGLWPYSFPYKRVQETHYLDENSCVGVRMYEESHESSPSFSFWRPPPPGQLLNVLLGLLKRTSELPATRENRHQDAPLHQLLDLDKNEAHSEAKSAALAEALGDGATPRHLAILTKLLELECLPWSQRTNPLPVPLPQPYQLLGLSSGFASPAMLDKANRKALFQVHPDAMGRRLGTQASPADFARERELANKRRVHIQRAKNTLEKPTEVRGLLENYARELLKA